MRKSQLATSLLLAAAAGCSRAPAPTIVQPGLPGEESRVVAARVPATAAAPHSAADVRFMQAMIGHHAQAMEMSALVPSRTTRQEIRMLAQRIDISQKDEIALMQKWLRDRNEAVPDPAHYMHSEHASMPGMLSAEQMQRLAAARGAEFDRLFLDAMILHHEGAVLMVERLFEQGGGAGPDIFRIAGEIDADQRAEIGRMRALRERL